MLKHHEIWDALDKLAAEHGLTPSGLARRAGLDATTFNKSKRVTRDGKLRWPSTESLAKVLEATATPFAELVALTGRSDGAGKVRLPIIGYAEAGSSQAFDEQGTPVGDGWKSIDFPADRDRPVFALEVSGDSMEPAYREGDVIVVSVTAPIAAGHRIVAKLRKGDLLVKQLGIMTDKMIELIALNPEHPNLQFEPSEILWVARVMWVSQ